MADESKKTVKDDKVIMADESKKTVKDDKVIMADESKKTVKHDEVAEGSNVDSKRESKGGESGSTNKPKRSCFKNFIGKVWHRNDETLDPHLDQTTYIKNRIKELVIYVLFLVFVCIISFSMASVNMFYYTKVLRSLFVESEGKEPGVSLVNIRTMGDFWDYAENPLLEGLYWRKWYNGKSEPDFQNLIYYDNLLVGVPRISQIRVDEGHCTIAEQLQPYISACYSKYDESYESKKSIDKNLVPIQNNTLNDETVGKLISNGWKYNDSLAGYSFWGKLASYPSRGYAVNLQRDNIASKLIVKRLKKQLWLRRGARAVFVDFTLYNANLNLFAVIKLSVEFPATGGAFPYASIQTSQLLRYFSANDLLVFGCEIVVMVFILYYLVEEIIEIADVGYRYIFDFWNLLDAALIIMALACGGLNIYRHNLVTKQLKEMDMESHISFTYIAHIEARFNNCVAILVFFSWVKVFKYISFNKTMTQLSTTLSRCAKDLLGFFIMFTIVFIAFTQLGYLLFGRQVQDFSTFLNSFYTLFRIILGDFNFHQLEVANPVLGPLFFMLFVFFVFFVLINMFLAIINDTYSEVKSDMAKQVDVFIMSDYIKNTYNNFMNKMTSAKEKLEHFEKILKTEGGTDKPMGYDEWKDLMIEQGFGEEEILVVFEKYDIDGDKVLDPDEQKAMFKELEKQAAKQQEEGGDIDDDDDEARDTVDLDDFMLLVRRVDRMEGVMPLVISKIDAVLAELSTIKL